MPPIRLHVENWECRALKSSARVTVPKIWCAVPIFLARAEMGFCSVYTKWIHFNAEVFKLGIDKDDSKHVFGSARWGK